jgi:hypothetical protein
MTGPFVESDEAPGLYLINDTAANVAPGLYSVGDLVETPAGSGLYAFAGLPALMYIPIITPYFDANPSPRVEVLFSSFAPGATSVTVLRSAGGREFPMRGAVKVSVAGALTRIDTEIPFGVEVSYRAEMFDRSGISLGFTNPSTIVMPVAETWVHNPLDPQNAVRVVMAGDAAQSISRPVPGSVVHPLGRHVGVAVSGTRRGVTGIVLDCYTKTDEEADKLAAMVGGYDDDDDTVPVLCFRISANTKMRIPRPFFAAVFDPREENHLVSKITWRMQGDEVSPPAPGLFIPFLTNADLDASYVTNAALDADPLNPTNLQVNRRYDLIGAAT